MKKTLIKFLAFSAVVAWFGCDGARGQNVQTFTCDKTFLAPGGSSTCTVTLDTAPTVPITKTITTTGGLTAPPSITFSVGSGTITISPDNKVFTISLSSQTMVFTVTLPAMAIAGGGSNPR